MSEKTETTREEAADPEHLDTKAIRRLFEAGGRLPLELGLVVRPGQADLAEYIAEVFHGLGIGLVEAPTGTGKTLAYLVPAVNHARARHAPAIVATATKNLQDQILETDGPRLRTIYPSLDIQVLKGKANYLCLRKVDAQAEEVRDWLHQCIEHGYLDYTDISKHGAKLETSPDSASHSWALGKYQLPDVWAGDCEDLRLCEKCPVKMARARCQRADLVVTNHALLASDPSGSVWPEPSVIVIDEAHRLQDAFTDAMTYSFGRLEFEALESVRGLLPRVGMGRGNKASVQKLIGDALQALARAVLGRTNSPRVTLDRPGFDDQETAADWRRLQDAVRPLLEELREALLLLESHEGLSMGEARRVVRARKATDALWLILRGSDQNNPAPDLQRVAWIEAEDGALKSAPLAVGRQIQYALWRATDTALLVSATLTDPSGNFDLEGLGLGAEKVDRLSAYVGEPIFDYVHQCLLAVPDMAKIDEANSAERLAQVGDTLAFLTRLHRGSTLALFTSYRELEQVAGRLAIELEGDYKVLAQRRSELSERVRLISEFEKGGAVLLGTQSFWEGFDMVGDKLQALVVVRLPFDVPTEPIHQARATLYEKPFIQYTLPRTLTKLRQGFGRLIRSSTDRGIVVLMDERLRSKPYGLTLLGGLPPCSTYVGTLEDLPGLATTWYLQGQEAKEEHAKA